MDSINLKTVLGIFRRVLGRAAGTRLSLTAAGVAFYALLSVFPGLAAIISIWGLTADRQDVVRQLQSFGRLLPPEALSVIATQAEQIASTGNDTIGFTLLVSVLISLFSASAAIRAIMGGLNIVLDERESRSFFRFQATALLITFVLAVGVIAALGAIVIAPILLSYLGLSEHFKGMAGLVRWPLLFFGAWGGIAALYRLAPSKNDSHWRWIAPAAGAAVIVWIIASIVLSIYVQNFTNYNQTYGSLGAVVGLMLWFWLSALSLFIGAEFGAELEGAHRKRAAGSKDKAAEPSKPQNKS
jgi:membrane protein